MYDTVVSDCAKRVNTYTTRLLHVNCPCMLLLIAVDKLFYMYCFPIYTSTGKSLLLICLSPISCTSIPTVTDSHVSDIVGFVYAEHANNLCPRCSMTGYAFLLSYGLILYRSKTQSSTATCSTRAEFLAEVVAAKKHCCLKASS